MTDRYLPIKSNNGKPDLVSYSGRSERFLRDLIRAGELTSFRSSPRGKIFVRPSWYDAYVDKIIREQQLISDEVRRFAQGLVA